MTALFWLLALLAATYTHAKNEQLLRRRQAAVEWISPEKSDDNDVFFRASDYGAHQDYSKVEHIDHSCQKDFKTCNLSTHVDSCDVDTACATACVPQFCRLPSHHYKNHFQQERFVKQGTVCGYMSYVQGHALGRNAVEVCCQVRNDGRGGGGDDLTTSPSCSTCDSCAFPQRVNDVCCKEALEFRPEDETGRDGTYRPHCEENEDCCKCGPASFVCIPKGTECNVDQCGDTTTFVVKSTDSTMGITSSGGDASSTLKITVVTSKSTSTEATTTTTERTSTTVAPTKPATISTPKSSTNTDTTSTTSGDPCMPNPCLLNGFCYPEDGGGFSCRLPPSSNEPTQESIDAVGTSSTEDTTTTLEKTVGDDAVTTTDATILAPIDAVDQTADPLDTVDPTSSPVEPTSSPVEPTSPPVDPTESPSGPPTERPSASPTTSPTSSPTETPTASPTVSPTASPTENPTGSPTESPTESPSVSPTESPTILPTASPTASPTDVPTSSPTASPTGAPTSSPTASPVEPTSAPVDPTKAPFDPTTAPVPTCEPNPCRNEGRCVEESDSYTCECLEGFSGSDCEITNVPSEPNPCLNGGVNTGEGDTVMCDCPEGYSGENCEIVLPCEPNPCRNGGECKSVGDANEQQFECDCANGFSGPTCSTCLSTQLDYILVGDTNVFGGHGITDLGNQLDCLDDDSGYNPNNVQLLNELADFDVEECLGMGDKILIDHRYSQMDFGGVTNMTTRRKESYARGIQSALPAGSTDINPSSTENAFNLTQQSLEPYKTVVLYSPVGMTTEEQEALYNFMVAGGRVIILAEGAPSNTCAGQVNRMIDRVWRGNALFGGLRQNIVGIDGGITTDNDPRVSAKQRICVSDGRNIDTRQTGVVLANYVNTMEAVIVGDNVGVR